MAHSAITIPLILSLWLAIKIPFHDLPRVQEERGRVWSVTSTDTSGGYVYPLEHLPLRDGSLSWEWRVAKFPRNDYRSFGAENDDYALRVGLIFSGGSDQIRLPLKLRSATKIANGSFVVMYAAVPNRIAPACGLVPEDKSFLLCWRPVADAWQQRLEDPVADLLRVHGNIIDIATLRAEGVWIFADSDDADSSSAAAIRALTLLARD